MNKTYKLDWKQVNSRIPFYIQALDEEIRVGMYYLSVSGPYKFGYEYSTDRINWSELLPAKSISYPATENCITVSAGQKLYIRASSASDFYNVVRASDWPWQNPTLPYLRCSGSCAAGGNLMFLLDYQGKYRTKPETRAQFKELFSYAGCVDASRLYIPKDYVCGREDFRQMFSRTNVYSAALRVAPTQLPETLAPYAFQGMFANCKYLEIPAPLPKTVIVPEGAYYDMYLNCTSLKAMPKLYGTQIGGYGYYQMFRGCSLIKVSETQGGEYQNPVNIGNFTLDYNNTQYMFLETGGTFTGSPQEDTIYYTSNPIIE